MTGRWSIALAATAAVFAGQVMLRTEPVRAGGADSPHMNPVPAHPGQRTDADFGIYASPLEVLLSPDGARLYVLCQQSNEVRVVATATGKTIKAISVGEQPRGFSFSPLGDKLYVANSWDDTISVIDTRSLTVVATWKDNGEPSSALTDKSGKLLFIANRVTSDVAVLDTQTGSEIKRLAAGRGASYMMLSVDGSRLYTTHIYPNLGAHRNPPESEITVIDPNTDAAQSIGPHVVERISLHRAAGVFHLAQSADGRLNVVAHFHPKNLVPLAHLEHGGAFGNSLTVFGADVGGTVEIPLDELDRYYAYPFGVAIAPDKSRIYVTHAGADCVTVISVPQMLAYIHQHLEGFAEDLSASAHYVVARIVVGKNPRGIAISRTGTLAYVANRLDDTISVIAINTNRVVRTIKLDGPKNITALRHGEQTFYTAKYGFQGHFGCSSCHLDSTLDGLTWDLEPDGFGVDIVDNRLLEDIKDTEPYKWNGGNPDVPTECGVRTEKYFWRSENYDNKTLADLTLYIRSIRKRPNRWQLPYGQLTPAQDRGKVIFERTVDAFGKPIPEINQCSYCHSGSKGTNQKSFDVGTKKPTDRSGLLDTPQLTSIALTAPYLHDGSARTLEEIWTVFNPHDQHGRTNDLTKDQLNDLVEYLRTR
jgi:YVTN family beta-propeller protein